MLADALMPGSRDRIVFEATPDGHDGPATFPEYSVHLGDRGCPIGNVLKRLLAEHHIEGGVFEGESLGVTFLPLDAHARWDVLGRFGDHVGVEIDTHDSPCTTDDGNCGGATIPSPAGEIEDPLPTSNSPCSTKTLAHWTE